MWSCIIFFFIYLAFSEELNMHFMFGADDFNALPSAVVMVSILNSTTSDEKLFFHFVGKGMNQTNLDMMMSLKEYFRPFTLDYVKFDMSRFFNTKIFRWNKKVMAKLFAPELFPGVDKILWIDHDMLILKNIRELFERDMEEKYIATTNLAEVSNQCIKKKITRWLHGGIDLLNLRLMRRDGLQKNLLRATNLYHRNLVRVCGGLDEYAMTTVINESKVVILPHRYNLFVRYFKNITFDENSYFNRKSSFFRLYNDEKNNCVVLHFIGKGKPWEKHSQDLQEFRSLYGTFFNLTQLAIKVGMNVHFKQENVSIFLPNPTSPKSSGRQRRPVLVRRVRIIKKKMRK